MDDLISRQAAIDAFDGVKVNEENCTEYDIGYNDGIDFAISRLSVLPSAEPDDYALHESCTDCPLYDHDKHSCPRFNKVIPETLRELQSAQPELATNLQQSCNQLATDTISRQALIDVLHTYFKDGFDEDRWWNSTHILTAIRALPSAEPAPSDVARDIATIIENEKDMRVIAQPVREGSWCVTPDGRLVCSCCYENPTNRIIINGDLIYDMTPIRKRMKFCPNCGADMRPDDN